MSIDGLSYEERRVLEQLRAADPRAAEGLAALDEVSRMRVVSVLGSDMELERVSEPVSGSVLGGGLSSAENEVLEQLRAADPRAAEGLAALDEVSRMRVVSQLGDEPERVSEPVVSEREPVSEPVSEPELVSGGGLSSEENEVLKRLRAADPDAADKLAALDEASQMRVVSQLGDEPEREPEPVVSEPGVSEPEPVSERA